MNLFYDLTSRLFISPSQSPSAIQSFPNLNQNTNNNTPLILQAPQQKDILFFNENGYINTEPIQPSPTQPLVQKQTIDQLKRSPKKSNIKTNKLKKSVKFPDDDKIIKDFSEAPLRGWIPGKHSTNDLLNAYIRSCDKQKSKFLPKLIPQLKALQDLDCTNGEKVNVLNLKNEKLDTNQIEPIEEVFKRLSFKTIDFELSQFEDDTAAATLFEILDYYDTCERLILANTKGLGLFGWQELSKYIRKTASLEYIDLKGQAFSEPIYFSYFIRSLRLTQSLKVIHLENSNMSGRLTMMFSNALKDNDQIKEIYLSDNRLQASDAEQLSAFIKENKCLELLDLNNNNLQDSGMSHICSGLSEKSSLNQGLKSLSVANNNLTSSSVSYLSKALIHNRTLVNLNVSSNSLTNEAIYELKEALIVNKQITSLIMTKTKLTDEGAIALAEYIAETQSLRRLDLRENDIRLGGLMALCSSLKFNKTLDRLDLNRESKREYFIKDSVETSKRLVQDINEYCLRNKREREKLESAKRDYERQQEEEEFKKHEEEKNNILNLQYSIDNTVDSEESTSSDTSSSLDSSMNGNGCNNNNNTNDEDIDLIAKDDELLRKILNRTFSPTSHNLQSPIHPNEDIINYFHLNKNEPEFTADEDLNFNLNAADFDKIIYKSTPIAACTKSNSFEMKRKKINFQENEDDKDLRSLIGEILDKIESDSNSAVNTSNCDNDDKFTNLEDEESIELNENHLNEFSLNLITPELTPNVKSKRSSLPKNDSGN